MADDVMLQLDRVSAEYLAAMIYNVGEHIAAGAPIPQMSDDECTKLAGVLDQLHRLLGWGPAFPQLHAKKPAPGSDEKVWRP